MKRKMKLALEALEEVDFIHDDNRRAFGEGFLTGFEVYKKLALSELAIKFQESMTLPNPGACMAISSAADALEFLGEEDVR